MAATFLVASYLLMYWLLETGTAAFASCLTTADPQTTGDYRWGAIPYLLSHVSMTFADGRLVDTHGGAWTPLTYLIALGGALFAGRLWRLLPASRRRATTGTECRRGRGDQLDQIRPWCSRGCRAAP